MDRFEAAIAQYTKSAHAAAVANGTAALHLALHALNIGPGDEVIAPTFTYIASINAIAQTGATPVLVDSNEADWQASVDAIEAAITPRTRCIMPVHLYGGACDMARICELAARHGLYVIEDCAEALGTAVDGRHLGAFGDIGAFSFYGNKVITTGEGGAVVTQDPELHRRLVLLKGQGQDPTRRYWHVELGFNYRMTNLAAAIGLGQIERIDSILARKRQIAAMYRDILANFDLRFPTRADGVESSEWLVSLLVPKSRDRDQIMARMAADGVETRPAFFCAHEMPHYRHLPTNAPIAESLARRGISLPSYPTLTQADIEKVTSSLLRAIGA